MKGNRYVSVTGHEARHMNLYFRRHTEVENSTGKHYSAYCAEATGARWSKEHQIVRARRIALAAIFFVELERKD